MEQRLASVLASRVDRILLVLECITDNRNYLGILRTCDVLGVQRVCVIHPPAGGHAQPTPAATSAAADGDEQCVPQLEQVRLLCITPTCSSLVPSSEYMLILVHATLASSPHHLLCLTPTHILSCSALHPPCHYAQGRKKNRIARASSSWLDIQHFSSSTAAIAALKQQVGCAV